MSDWAPPEAASTPSWQPPEASQAAPQWTPPEAGQQPEQDGEFYKGLQRGSAAFNASVENIPDMLEGAIDKYTNSKLFNPDKIVAEEHARLAKVQKTDAAYPAAVKGIKDINSLDTLGGYAAGQLGEQIPNLALMLETGGIAGAATKGVLTDAAALAGEDATSAAMQQAIAKGATRSAMITSGLAGAAPAASQNYSQYLEQGVDAPGVAIGAGLLTSAVQTLVPSANIGKVLGAEVAGNSLAGVMLNKMGITNNLLNKVIGGAVTSGVEMSGTNAAAEAVNMLAEHEIGLNPNLYTKENANRLVEAMGSGLVGGAVMGAGMGPLAPHAPTEQTTKEHVDDYVSKTEKRPANEQDLETAKAMQDKAAVSPNDKAMLNQKRVMDDMDEPPANKTERSPNDDTSITSIKSTPAEIKYMEQRGYKVEDRQRFSDKEWEYVKSIHEAMDKGHPIPEPPAGVDISAVSKLNVADLERLSEHLTQSITAAKVNKVVGDKKFAEKGDMVKWSADQSGKLYKVKSSDEHGVMLDNDGNDVLPEVHAAHDEVEIAKASLMDKMDKEATPLTDAPASKAAYQANGTLPRDLRNAKPRYVNAKLEFPSDIEKALYISGLNSKSKREVDYKSWLNAQGFSDQEINRYHKQIKNEIKQSHNIDDTQESIKVSPIERDKATSQKIAVPRYGDAYQDHVMPYKIATNMLAMPLKNPEKYRGIIDNISRIVQELTGNKNVSFWKSMRETPSQDIVAGAQILHTIHVALNDSISWAQAHETAYHEVYHMLVRSGVISAKERALWDHSQLRDYMMKDGHLSKEDFKSFLEAGPDNREELEANAFGKMMVEQHLSGTNSAPGMFKSAFNRAMNFIKRVGYMLKGNDVSSIHDLLGKASAGVFKEGLKKYATDTEAHTDLQNNFASMQGNLAEARLQRVEKEQTKYNSQRAHEEMLAALDNLALHPSNEAYKNVVEAASNVESHVSIENNRQNQAVYSRFINTPAITAVKHPIFALLQNHLLNKREVAANYTSQFHEALQPVLKSNRQDLYAVCDTMAKAKELRLRGIETVKGAKLHNGTPIPEGSIAFANQGRGAFINTMEPITNKEHVRIYKALQAAMGLQHDEAEKAYKVKAGQQFSDLLPDAKALQEEHDARVKSGWSFKPGEKAPEIYQLEHVSNALNKLKVEDPESSRIAKLQTLHDNLIDSQLMRRVDYIPFQRYGKFAFTVRSRKPEHIGEDGKAKQIALHTVEEGVGGTGMNQRQLERAVKDLKAKYGDLKDFDVIGARGKVTNFNDKSQLMPYVLDHNNLAKNIDPRYMNVEMFSAMAHASKVDEAVFRQVVDQIENSIVGDTASRGFGRVFGKSENLGGYSKDWARVLHTSTGGVAKMLSNLHHAQEHGALEAAIPKIEDGRLREQAKAFWNYAASPNEDLQALRSINYLYAMGGNLSSAAVQLSTLMTRVWPEMAKYSPNYLGNLLTIGKNLSKAATYYGKAWSTGDTHAAREYMVKNKLWTQEQSNVHRRAEMDNVLQSAMLQDAMRGGVAEDTSKFKHGLEAVSKGLALPVWKAEQLLRSATMMSVHEMISKSPESEAAAKRINAKDANIQAKMATRPDMGIAEHMGRYTLGLAHGEYGKEGRAAIYRGVGGIAMPFQNFVHNTLERLVHDAQGTPEERRAFKNCVAALMMMGGMAGVPGVSFLEKMYDQLAKLWGDDQEIDTQRMIYEKISGLAGEKAAKAITYGLPRLAGVSMSERLGVGSIPGQGQITGLMEGMGKAPISSYAGVEGSKFAEVQRARAHYQAGFGPNTLIGAMMPSGIDNLSKAYDLYKNGVMTTGIPPKQITGLRPQDVTKPDILMRMLGVESGHIADLKQKYYEAERLHGNKEYQNMFNEYEAKMINHGTLEQRAIANRDWDTAHKEHQAYLDMQNELYKKANKYSARIPPGFNGRVSKGIGERLNPQYPTQKEKGN